MSRTAVRGITKKFKESSVIRILSGRGRKAKISKTLERKLVRDVSKNPRITAKSLVNDLAKPGFEVSEKTVTRALHRNGLRGYRPTRTPQLQKRHLQGRLKLAKENLQKPEGHCKRVMWSDETKLELFGHKDVAYVWRKQGDTYRPKNIVHILYSETWWGKYNGLGVFQRWWN